VLTLGMALASVLAHAGFGTTFGFLAHFAPLYLLAAPLVAVAVASKGLAWRRTILGAGSVAVIASGLLIAPEFTRDTGPKAEPGAVGEIKVIQLNALRHNADVTRVAKWLAAQNPDVVTISEARPDLRDLLIKRVGWKTAGARGSLMIFTRTPYEGMSRPRPVGSAPLVFVNATYANPTGPIEVLTTHLDRQLGPSVASQIAALESVARQLPRDRMIMTGDFNATPWSAEIRQLDRSLGLARRDRAVPSWPAQVFGRPWPLPLLPIDHVYAGRGWATVSVERGPWLGSDHYPVIVRLAPVPALAVR
jgi:endonuclease/exonuclease/phosphatase (EEP) superfamily protein YafD